VPFTPPAVTAPVGLQVKPVIMPIVTSPPGVDIALFGQLGKLEFPRMDDDKSAPGFSEQYVATSSAQPLTTGKA